MENSEQNAVPGLQAIPESATRPAQVQLPEPAALREPERVHATGTPIFDLQGVSIFYGSFKAVTNVSLTIYEREITAFIGPSGCGKTTVLRTLNRMNDLVPGAHVEGDVRYRGESLYSKNVSPIAVRRRIGMVFQKPNPFPKSIYDNVAYGPRINGIRSKSKMNEIKDRYTIVIVTHNMQQATRVSDRTAFFSVLVNPESVIRTGTLVEYAPTDRLFGDPQDDRT